MLESSRVQVSTKSLSKKTMGVIEYIVCLILQLRNLSRIRASQMFQPICDMFGDFVFSFHHEPMSTTLNRNVLILFNKLSSFVDDKWGGSGVVCTPKEEVR
jgi:hypothetical protein